MHAVVLECGLKLGEQILWASENEVVMESWRVELVKGNAGEFRARWFALEPTIIESVIKCWRAELWYLDHSRGRETNGGTRQSQRRGEEGMTLVTVDQPFRHLTNQNQHPESGCWISMVHI